VIKSIELGTLLLKIQNGQPKGAPGNTGREIEPKRRNDQLNMKASLKTKLNRHVEYQNTSRFDVDVKYAPRVRVVSEKAAKTQKGVGDPKRVETWQLALGWQTLNPSRKPVDFRLTSDSHPPSPILILPRRRQIKNCRDNPHLIGKLIQQGPFVGPVGPKGAWQTYSTSEQMRRWKACVE
jgi:hypothetical protein